jgi:hypothetical protein
MKLPDRRTGTLLGAVLLAGGVLMLMYWALYLTGVADLGQSDPVVAGFEAAFLLADTVLGTLLFLAGWMLLKGRPLGPYLMVVAASMSVYLGLLDLVFYSRHGLFSSTSGAGAFELVLVGTCLIAGSVCLRVGWNLWSGGDS